MPDGIQPPDRDRRARAAAETADSRLAPARPAQPRAVERRHDAAHPARARGRALRRGRRLPGRRRDRPARSRAMSSSHGRASGSRRPDAARVHLRWRRRTFALALDPDGNAGPRAARAATCRRACPYEPGVDGRGARAGKRHPDRPSIGGRRRSAILTETVDVAGRGPTRVQVVQDRTTEQQTLQVMLVVLLVGGLRRRSSWRSGSGRSTRGGRSSRSATRSTTQRVALRRQREFAADASHELRTPLTVIRSSVEHLERHRDEPVATVGSRARRTSTTRSAT